MTIGAALEGGRLRAVERDGDAVRVICDLAVGEVPAALLRRIAAGRVVLADAPAAHEVVSIGAAPAAVGDADEIRRRLLDRLPGGAKGTVTAAAEFAGPAGATTFLVARVDERDVGERLEPFARAGALPFVVEPAEAAYLRLLERLAAGAGPAGGGGVPAALAVLGELVDRYLAVSAAGVPVLVADRLAGLPPPASLAETAGTLFVTGPRAAAGLAEIEKAVGERPGAEVRLWAPPGSDGGVLDPSWAAAYAASLDGPPAIDVTPERLRAEVVGAGRAHRRRRFAAAAAAAITVAGLGVAGGAEALLRSARADRAAAEAERRSLDAEIAAVAAEVAVAEARASVRVEARPVSPVLEAALATVPAGVRLEEIGPDVARRAPRPFPTLRAAGGAAGGAANVRPFVIRGTASSYEEVEAYRSALGRSAAVRDARLRKADRAGDLFRFEIVVEG